MPKVEKFSNNFDGFLKTVNDIKEVVRRFDEDLCIKASKADLQNAIRGVETSFIPNDRWLKVYDDVTVVKDLIIK